MAGGKGREQGTIIRVAHCVAYPGSTTIYHTGTKYHTSTVPGLVAKLAEGNSTYGSASAINAMLRVVNFIL